MKKLLKIGVAGLFVLVALLFSESSSAYAQHRVNDHHHSDYHHKKGGPPAHGYRHKHEHKKNKHDKHCCHYDSRSRQHSHHEDVYAKRRPQANLPKRTVVIVHTH
ncbi:hypothetical protein D770_06470 [Flammeovirgaceae bacterium 311]|nr:hypothetical protein D770_06470 [Flammeovirgaceae bacterium 311]